MAGLRIGLDKTNEFSGQLLDDVIGGVFIKVLVLRADPPGAAWRRNDKCGEAPRDVIHVFVKLNERCFVVLSI